MAAEEPPKEETPRPTSGHYIDADGKKRKVKMPPVKYLLAYGPPEDAHKPKTWFQLVGMPFLMAMIFAASLLVFHHAPWDTLPRRKKYSVGKYKRRPGMTLAEMQAAHAARVPHLNKARQEAEKKTEL